MARINLNSNIVSGIYSFIEVLLLLLVHRFIRIILSCHNLYTIYDARKPLHLRTTRLSLLLDPGLASLHVSRLFALLGILIGALLTAGGFAFTGATETAFESIRMRNKVTAASPGNYIDFRNHVSSDGKLVSATLELITRNRYCVSQARKEDIYFSWANNNVLNLSEVNSPDTAPPLNSTCLSKESGFREEILRRDTIVEGHPPNCTLSLNLSNIRLRNETITSIPVAEAFRLNNCNAARVIECLCSNYWSLTCVGSWLVDDENFLVFLFDFSTQRWQHSTNRSLKKHDTELLKSMAFLADFFSLTRPVNILNALIIASSRVETNSNVQKIVGERNYTSVNAGLLVGTFGTALALCIGMGVATFMIWIYAVWLKGRRGYNGFCSSADVLSSAAATHQFYGAASGIWRAKEGQIVGGVGGIVVRRIRE